MSGASLDDKLVPCNMSYGYYKIMSLIMVLVLKEDGMSKYG